MAHDLAVILDDMHAAILAGDFNRLTALVPDLEVAREQVEQASHANPATIRYKAQRNALCLQAAIQGVKSARRRVAEIVDAARGLTTYDRIGGKATLSSAPPRSKRV